MSTEKIKVRATSSGNEIDVVVFSKSPERITVVVGSGIDGVRCTLNATANGAAYAGSVMGRELVYERSRDQVTADIARVAGYREFRR
ncbi:MAG: hypothetical protein KDH20_22430 [Rhodocyclaceae bacterium]|nr:hypothetical protein [Rhodocyclaceae bacterium]